MTTRLTCPQCGLTSDDICNPRHHKMSCTHLYEYTQDGILLFVDDERNPPHGWTLARTSEGAMQYLELWKSEEFVIRTISLDHDLGFPEGEEDNTRRLVLWMCENDFWPENIYVHTGNPSAEDWLVGMVKRYAPPGTLKGYGVNYWGTTSESIERNDY